MWRAQIAAALFGSLAATPTWSDVMLPCGTARVPMRKAEEIWARDSRIFALCTTAPGATVTYLDPWDAAGATAVLISESPEVYFSDGLEAANGLIYLKLRVPEELNCGDEPPRSHVLLSSMDCKFRSLDAS